MDRLVIDISPWLCAFVALWYWSVLIKEEILRHYQQTGKRWPPLRERKSIVLVKPKRTHLYGWTAMLFTFTLVNMIYRPHPAGVGVNVTLLIIYIFVALWCGPMLQIIPTLEGVMLMAATCNCALYLGVHTWALTWMVFMLDTFIIVIYFVGLFGLRQFRLMYGNRRAASRRRPPAQRPH